MTSHATTQSAPPHGTLVVAVALEPREIGRRIAEARDRKGWTQLTFALEAHVSPSTVQRWESGKLPPVRELVRIAELLGVEPEQLVEAEPTGEDQIAALRGEVEELHEMVAELLRRSA